MTIEEIHRRVLDTSAVLDEVLTEVHRVIVGQDYLLRRILVGLLANGHILLEGVPGLAKTLTVSTLAATLHSSFKRIQFTPDLLPADITGTLIYHQKTGEFEAKQGPIFANLVLADEINRAPSKVQSALLEAMQERQVTIGDKTYPLPRPFLVMATQNPLEQEGTYPLPEAQVDRFMLKVKVDYPNRTEERQIMDRMVRDEAIPVRSVLTPDQIMQQREVVQMIHMEDRLKDYILDLVFATRDAKQYKKLQDISAMIECGASPRATIYLARAAKAHAYLEHRGYVIPDDVKAVGKDVLRHRLILSYEAEAEQISADQILTRVFDEIEVP